jgi:HEAT repeat protein
MSTESAQSYSKRYCLRMTYRLQLVWYRDKLNDTVCRSDASSHQRGQASSDQSVGEVRDDEQDIGILIYRRSLIENIWGAIFMIFGSGKPDVEKMEKKKDVKGLIKALGYEKDSSVRKSATYALGKIGDARAVEPLTKALNDADSDVRRDAAKALGKIGDRRAVELLTRALNDSREYVRMNVAIALGKIGDVRAVEPLTKALNDSNSEVRSGAAGALDSVGWTPGRDELAAAYWILRGQWDKCVEIGGPAVEPLIRVLNDSNYWNVSRDAAEALGKIGDSRAVKPLIRALEDGSNDVRKSAAEALGKIGEPAVEPLIKALNDTNEHVRVNAAEALGKIGWTPGRNEAAAAYWTVKKRWGTCVEIGEPAVEPLKRALSDTDGIVRENAAKALGEIGDSRAVEPLIRALNDADWPVRDGAAEALDSVGWTPGRDEAAATYWIARGRWDKCVAIGEPATKPLVKALYGNVDAAIAVSELGDPRAIEPLIRALNERNYSSNSHWKVRVNAAEALVRLYRDGRINQSEKQAILAVRATITKPHDDHVYFSKCGSEFDGYTDTGIGLSFPF